MKNMTLSDVLKLPTTKDCCTVRLSATSADDLYHALRCVRDNVLNIGEEEYVELDGAPYMAKVRLFFDICSLIPFDDKSKAFFRTEDTHSRYFFNRLECYIKREDVPIVAAALFMDLQAMVVKTTHHHHSGSCCYTLSDFSVGDEPRLSLQKSTALPDHASMVDFLNRIDKYCSGCLAEFKAAVPEECAKSKGYPFERSIRVMLRRQRLQSVSAEVWDSEMVCVLQRLVEMSTSHLSNLTALPFHWLSHSTTINAYCRIFGDSHETLSIGYAAIDDLIEKMRPAADDDEKHVECFVALLQRPYFVGSARLVADVGSYLEQLEAWGAPKTDVCSAMATRFYDCFLKTRSALVECSPATLSTDLGFSALIDYGVVGVVESKGGAYGVKDYWSSIDELKILMNDQRLTFQRCPTVSSLVDSFRIRRMCANTTEQHFTPRDLVVDMDFYRASEELFSNPNDEDGMFEVNDDATDVYLYFGHLFEPRHVLTLCRHPNVTKVVVVTTYDAFKSRQGTNWIEDVDPNAPTSVSDSKPKSWKLVFDNSSHFGDLTSFKRKTTIVIRHHQTTPCDGKYVVRDKSDHNGMFGHVQALANYSLQHVVKKLVCVAEDASTRKDFQNAVETLNATNMCLDERNRGYYRMVRSSKAPNNIDAGRDWAKVGFGCEYHSQFLAPTSKNILFGSVTDVVGFDVAKGKRIPSKGVWVQQHIHQSSKGKMSAPLNNVYFQSSRRAPRHKYEPSVSLAMRPVQALQPCQLNALNTAQVCYWVDPALRGDALSKHLIDVGKGLMRMAESSGKTTTPLMVVVCGDSDVQSLIATINEKNAQDMRDWNVANGLHPNGRAAVVTKKANNKRAKTMV